MANEFEIKIWVGNLGKYNEGKLVGQWFTLPHDVSDIMKKIGVAYGTEYEEYEIFDFEVNPIVNIKRYSSLKTLNEIAESLSAISNDKLEILAVLMENGIFPNESHTALSSIENFMDNEDYVLYEDCDSKGDLAERYALESGFITDENPLYSYVDFDDYAEDFFSDRNIYHVKDKTWVEWSY